MNKLGHAIAITAAVFDGKEDKQGQPYILHCLRVMNALHTRDQELQQIAVMHDVLEDTATTVEELRGLGFSERVLDALKLLDFRGKDYDAQIKLIAHNNDATRVKLADLKDNSDITRLKGLTKKDFDKMEKYHRAYTYLSSVIIK